MAKVQDVFANEECDKKLIPTHGTHFGVLWEAHLKLKK